MGIITHLNYYMNLNDISLLQEYKQSDASSIVFLDIILYYVSFFYLTYLLFKICAASKKISSTNFVCKFCNIPFIE